MVGHMPCCVRTSGFTLAEFLTVIAVIAVLTSLAVPGFGALNAAIALRTAANDLAHAFHAGRQEALSRGVDIALCPSSDGVQCDYSANWDDGWLMFADRGTAARPFIQADEPVLLQHSGSARTRILANRAAFRLRTFGRRSTNGTFVFCDPRGQASARRLVISYTGKPRAELAPSDRCAR